MGRKRTFRLDAYYAASLPYDPRVLLLARQALAQAVKEGAEQIRRKGAPPYKGPVQDMIIMGGKK